MPRKRKTKASVSSTRPKAKIPDGDEGKGLTKEEKLAKLELLLADFDNEGIT